MVGDVSDCACAGICRCVSANAPAPPPLARGTIPPPIQDCFQGRRSMGEGLIRMRRWVVSLSTLVLVLGLASAARADRAFTARFSTNANGDIAVVGNTLETCQTAVADCANARAGLGTALNNNNFSMVRVNTDSALARFLVRAPDLARGRSGAVRGSLLRLAHDRGNGREGRAGRLAGGVEQGRPQGAGRLRLRAPDQRGRSRAPRSPARTPPSSTSRAGAARRVRGVHRRQRAVRDRGGPVRRLVARGRLRGRRRAASQPDRVRRAPVGHPDQAGA